MSAPITSGALILRSGTRSFQVVTQQFAGVRRVKRRSDADSRGTKMSSSNAAHNRITMADESVRTAASERKLEISPCALLNLLLAKPPPRSFAAPWRMVPKLIPTRSSSLHGSAAFLPRSFQCQGQAAAALRPAPCPWGICLVGLHRFWTARRLSDKLLAVLRHANLQGLEPWSWRLFEGLMASFPARVLVGHWHGWSLLAVSTVAWRVAAVPELCWVAKRIPPAHSVA